LLYTACATARSGAVEFFNNPEFKNVFVQLALLAVTIVGLK